MKNTSVNIFSLRFLVLVLTVVLISAFGSFFVAKKVIYNKPWKTNVIKVYNASDWKLTGLEAVRKWNEAKIGITFQMQNQSKGADLIIKNDEDKVSQGKTCYLCMGRATLGKTLGKKSYIWLLPDIEERDKRMTPGDTSIITHEMGHVLGLEHRDDVCSLMNTELREQKTCGEQNKRSCGPLKVDLQQLNSQYKKGFSKVYSSFCAEEDSKTWSKHREQNIEKLSFSEQKKYQTNLDSFKRQEQFLLRPDIKY